MLGEAAFGLDCASQFFFAHVSNFSLSLSPSLSLSWIHSAKWEMGAAVLEATASTKTSMHGITRARHAAGQTRKTDEDGFVPSVVWLQALTTL